MAIKSKVQFFAPEAMSIWKPQLERMSNLNLPIKTIADSFGCSYQRLSTDDDLMSIIRVGWSNYRERIEQELWNLATAEPQLFDDPVERSEVRKQKLVALKAIHVVLHREPFIAPIEQERVRRLSDEELQEELKKHITTGNIDGVISSKNRG